MGKSSCPNWGTRNDEIYMPIEPLRIVKGLKFKTAEIIGLVHRFGRNHFADVPRLMRVNSDGAKFLDPAGELALLQISSCLSPLPCGGEG